MPFFDKIISIPPATAHQYGYIMLMISAFLESAWFIGLLIPGQIILIAAGFLAKMHVFSLGKVIAFSAAGALLGDSTAYFIGSLFGKKLMKKKIPYLKKKAALNLKRLMQNHPAKLIITGRFNSLTRAFIPFIAGLAKVEFKRFIALTTVSCLAWAVAFSLIGYFFGKSYEVITKYMNATLWLAIVAIALIIYIKKTFKKRKRIEILSY